MALNKDEKANLKTALFFLEGRLKNKPELKEGGKNEVIFKWKDSDTIDDKLDQTDKTDKELLRHIADRVFGLLADQPELLKELKEKYFKDL